MKQLSFLCLFIGCSTSKLNGQTPFYLDSSKPTEIRTADLLSKLTLEEKVSLLGYRSAAVPRLNIPAYNWWNEALHGVARAGEATMFPQAIGMSASFNDELLHQVAEAISTEARAKYNLAVAKDRRVQYMGLTFWSPNINIFRDPRWGRGQETYGEDPYLTGKLGVAFVKGMQGNDPNHLKTAACAKHYAVHSGPERERHSFDAKVDNKDLRETYLPAFKKLVDAGVESVMGAYNRVNGEPATISKTLIGILRNEWGFKGHYLTDCWALQDIYKGHNVLPNSVTVAAAAIKAGVNLDCSDLIQDDLVKAFKQGLVTEKEIDNSLAVLLKAQFKLGFYDAAKSSPYSSYGADSVHNASHIALSRKMAAQSMVLLKNENNALPLDKKTIKKIYVTGGNSSSVEPLMGNYFGVSPSMVTFLEGIIGGVTPDVSVVYDMGVVLNDSTHFSPAYNASESEVTIAVLGLNPLLEGEDGDAFLTQNGADKVNLSLPASHIAYIKSLRTQTKKPIIAVLTGGSAMDVEAIKPYADAIIIAWYPGEQGGNALADIVFGDVSPAGRLPITFYNSITDLPAYNDYNMAGKTYRYFKGKAQYPFGYGLSYTSFKYGWNTKPSKSYTTSAGILNLSVTIENTGGMNGDEVAQVYVKYPSAERMPVKELKGFKRVTIEKGSKKEVKFEIPFQELMKWDLKANKFKLYKGEYQLFVGGSSEDERIISSFLIK